MTGTGKKDRVSKARRKSLRLVLLASEYTIWENSVFLRHLLTGLSDESIPAVLVRPQGCDDSSVSFPGVEVIGHPAIDMPLLSSQNRRILAGRLEKFKPSVVHCLCESYAPLARNVARGLQLPYVLTVNCLQSRFGKLSFSSKRLAKIIVPAKTIADSIAKFYPQISGLVEQINVGTFVSSQISCFSEQDRVASIVVAAALDNAGSFEVLFRAIRRLAIDGHEFMMVLVGEGKAEKAVRQLLDGFGLLPATVFASKAVNLRAVLSAGDIFIRPRPVNFFDPMLLEAMSAGTVVAGCKGGVDDLIVRQQTAVVFDPDDELSIYNSLLGFFNNRQLARKLAAAAQGYLRENHTVSKMLSRLLEIYLDSAGKR